jgi:hypothetical protein
MTITKKTNHVDEAQDHLIEQFRGKANFNAMIAALVEQIQDLEEAAFEVFEQTDIYSAVGVQLDGIGAIVGQPRQGRNDVDYRIAIFARIAVNISSGTPEEIINALLLFEPSNLIQVFEFFPAQFTVEYLMPIIADGQTMARVLNTIRPAGVYGQLLWHTTVDTFQFSSTSSSEIDSTKGFSNAAQTTGGQFASASEG